MVAVADFRGVYVLADKGVFFLLLSLALLWLVLDEFYGNHLITNFISAMIPSAVAE